MKKEARGGIQEYRSQRGSPGFDANVNSAGVWTTLLEDTIQIVKISQIMKNTTILINAYYSFLL